MSVKGGGERVAIHSMLAGLRAGYSVSLVSEAFDADDFEDFFGCQGLMSKVNWIQYPAFTPKLNKSLLLYQRLVYHGSSIRRVLSHRADFDLVLGTQDVGYVPSVRIPVIQYCYFPEYFSHLEARPESSLWRLYYWPASRLYRSKVARVSRLLATSNYTQGFVKSKWGRDSETLYPPCPTELYSSRILPKEDMVITVGRIVPEKRMNLFIEIARKLPTCRFVVVGSIDEQRSEYYASLKRTATSNVSFVLSPLRKAWELLARSKVYVHCTLNEHFGITVVEAMAAGCVPVVHDSGGPKEIVPSQVGYRWTNTQDAADRISDLLRNDGLRRRLAVEASRRAEIFGTEAFEANMSRILQQYLK